MQKAVIAMEYRLCVCVDEKKGKSAYAFYNQQDFCVYRRVVEMTQKDGQTEFVLVCETALEYFRKNMRNRYYTEHFSELLDEDRCIVLCSDREPVDVFLAYRESGAEIPEKYTQLKGRFDIWSVSFEYSADSGIQRSTAQLLEDT